MQADQSTLPAHLRDAPPTVLSKAREALAGLIEEGAPASVIAAGRFAIGCVQASVPVPRHIQQVLMGHAQRRMAQNRYGK
jgi:hypothetical protein